MSYESWRISFQSSEAAARSAYKDAKDLQERLALKDLEIVRLREVLETCKVENVGGLGELYFDVELVEEVLSNPPTKADLDAYVEAQYGKPVAWFHEDYPSERFGDLEKFAYNYGSTNKARPLYAKKG